MDFKEATGRLLDLGFDLREIAAAVHLGHQTVRSMRLSPEASTYRKPPPPEKWRGPLAALARQRMEGLRRFVEDAET